VTLEIYKRLLAGGADVRLLTATPYDSSGEGEVEGVPVVRVRSMDLSRLLGAQVSLSPRLAGLALRLVDGFRPDVLHANSLHFQTSIAAAFAQQRRGIPMVTTAHIGSSSELRGRIRLATGVYERTVGRYILGRSTRVIAVAPSVADHLRTLGVPADRIDVVPNGVDQTRFAPRQPAGNHDRDPGEAPLVVFVGRLIDNKGPQLFVEALATLRDQGVGFRAALVGDGPMEASLRSRVAGAGLAELVHFAGQSSDVPGWLAKASVFVRPSFTEGMPLTVLEAMASGTPVVVSDIPGNTELVRDGVNGLLFSVGDATSLAGKLRRAIEDGEGAAKMAAAASETARSYTWDACAASTLKVLTQAAAGASVGASA
jgi:glycosyltransferase involved in cell wall biosynthesis